MEKKADIVTCTYQGEREKEKREGEGERKGRGEGKGERGRERCKYCKKGTGFFPVVLTGVSFTQNIF